MDYDALLKRGRDGLHGDVEQKNRFEVPSAQVNVQGKRTIVVNFGDVCDRISRDPDTVAKYLLRELGTAGTRSEGRIVLNGAFAARDVDAVIGRLVGRFVICKVCHLPDTRLAEEGKNAFIHCEACGARYQVKAIR